MDVDASGSARDKQAEMTERSSLKEEERKEEVERKSVRESVPDIWGCDEISTTPVYKAAINSTIIIVTFAAFIGFAYFVWVGIQAFGKGLASLDWDAFRDALEDLKRRVRLSDNKKGLRDDQNAYRLDGHPNDVPYMDEERIQRDGAPQPRGHCPRSG